MPKPSALDALQALSQPRPPALYGGAAGDATGDPSLGISVPGDPNLDALGALARSMHGEYEQGLAADTGYQEQDARRRQGLADELAFQHAGPEADLQDFQSTRSTARTGRAYFDPMTQGIRADQQRTAEVLARTRYVDPAEARATGDLGKATIDANGRVAAAQATGAAGNRSAEISARAREIAQMLNRGDFGTDAEGVAKAGAAIHQLEQMVGGGGGDDPHVSMATQQGPGDHEFSDGQVWRVAAGKPPQRIK